MSVEEHRHPLDHSRRINAIRFQPRDPGSKLLKENNARLTLKLLHDVQKLVVNFWSFPEPVLDEIQVCEGVGDVEGSGCTVRCCRRRRGVGQHD